MKMKELHIQHPLQWYTLIHTYRTISNKSLLSYALNINICVVHIYRYGTEYLRAKLSDQFLTYLIKTQVD